MCTAVTVADVTLAKQPEIYKYTIRSANSMEHNVCLKNQNLSNVHMKVDTIYIEEKPRFHRLN